jgi:hypothetical protein
LSFEAGFQNCFWNIARIILEMSILEIPRISYLPVLRRTRHSNRKIVKTALKTRLKTQEKTYAYKFLFLDISKISV